MLSTESASSVTDCPRIAGRSVDAHDRTESRNAGRLAMISWPWLIAFGTTMKASPTTVTKNVT